MLVFHSNGQMAMWCDSQQQNKFLSGAKESKISVLATYSKPEQADEPGASSDTFTNMEIKFLDMSK